MKVILYFKQFIDLLKYWVVYVIFVYYYKDYYDKIKIKVYFRFKLNIVNK